MWTEARTAIVALALHLRGELVRAGHARLVVREPRTRLVQRFAEFGRAALERCALRVSAVAQRVVLLFQLLVRLCSVQSSLLSSVHYIDAVRDGANVSTSEQSFSKGQHLCTQPVIL